MIDNDEIQTTLRKHAMGMVIATTGNNELEVTATGFKRILGSFIDENFRRGMEIISSGFPAADNVRAIITSVSPTDMRVSPFVITIANGVQTVVRPVLVPSAAAIGRTITAVIPSMWSLENEAPIGLTEFIPVTGIPYVEEEYSTGPNRTFGVPVKRARLEYTGEYFLKLHGVSGSGVAAMRKTMDAIEAHFAAGTTLVTPRGYKITMSSDPAPATQNMVRTTSGPVLPLYIPWIVRSRNVPVSV